MKTTLKTNKPSLYIHIPFCSHLCHYCDFTKFFYQKKWIKAYLNTLKNEIASFKQTSFFTIYVGGGTPTSLEYDELKELLEIIKPYTKDVAEYTFECNIESTTKEKLEMMLLYGVDRLSFGVQSTNNERLKEIGRMHTFEDIKRIIGTAKQIGYKRMSVDLIYGLPHQSIEELEKDIDEIIGLEVDHISTYSLTIHPHTVAYIQKWPQLTNERSREYYDLILNKLSKVGFTRYEVSNFARNNQASLHNHIYWYSRPFYGAGYGASGYLIKHNEHRRYRNIGKLSHYLEGQIEKEEEILTLEQQEIEFLMNNLRLKAGFALSEYEERFGDSFLTKYKDKIDFLVEQGLVKVENERIFCLDEGLIKLDYILFKLL